MAITTKLIKLLNDKTLKNLSTKDGYYKPHLKSTKESIKKVKKELIKRQVKGGKK